MTGASALASLRQSYQPPPRGLVIRVMHGGEEPPGILDPVMRGLPLDPEWIWLAEQDGCCQGVCVCGVMHGLLYFIRMVVAPEADKTLSLILLRRVFRDAKLRGCVGFMTLLTDKNPAEVKFMRIVQKLGATLVPTSGVLVSGRL